MPSCMLQAGIKIAGRNINNLRYADDTTLMAESEEKLKRLLMRMKEGSEKTGLLLLLSHFSRVQLCATPGLLCPWDSPGKNTGVGCHFLLQCMKVESESEVAQSCLTLSDPMGLQPTRLLHPWDFPGNSSEVGCHCLLRKTGLKCNIKKTEVTASGPITSWQIEGKKVETVTDFLFLGSKITADGDYSHEIRRNLFLGRKAMTNLDHILKSKDINLPTKVCIIKAVFFQ